MDSILEMKECPFCGKKSFTNVPATELIDIEYLSDSVYEELSNQYVVVCDVGIDGCGASTNRSTSPDEANHKWNRRVNTKEQRIILGN